MNKKKTSNKTFYQDIFSKEYLQKKITIRHFTKISFLKGIKKKTSNKTFYQDIIPKGY